MDHCAQATLLSFDDALARILEQTAPINNTEVISVEMALDRILAADIQAPINVPPANNSAMDGYAISLYDSDSYQLIGEALAGHPFTGELKQGEAIRITTGGVIPPGANAVVMQENIIQRGNRIHLQTNVDEGDNIRRAGEDIAQGAIVITSGTRLSPLHVGLLASLGIPTISVFKKIRVAVLSTGDELLQPGDQPVVGKIYDSNRPMLMAFLQRLAVDIWNIGCIKDNPDDLRKHFLHASKNADVVISSGGVSVGDADFTKDILMELGDIGFYKIAMKPGKPLAYGKFKDSSCWFFGLPGNPVSSAVTFHQLVLPGLRRLSGEIFSLTESFPAIANAPLKKQPGRKDFQRGVLSSTENGFVITTSGLQSSAVLSGLAKANAYIVLEQERGKVNAGETVQVIPFDRFIF